ncbi:MAG: 4Fe-4S dicluster domain-containing protein [Acidobacteriota bacterium]|nr:4Fe-4S dicluster domain-containing protein [Acidobacteriota bacterium]
MPGFRVRGRHVRLASQVLFLLAFTALFWTLAWVPAAGRLASSFLALDPTTAVGTALADWTIPRWSWIGLVILAATGVLGRFFCGWICPLGTLQQFVSWATGPQKRKATERNRYRRWFATKYVLLLVLMIWALLGANHFGWLAPIPLLSRALAVGVRPLWHGGEVPGGWISFGLAAAILLASAWMPRFFCRALCPTGALMGLFARLAPLRIRRSDTACTDCNLCLLACQGADEPLGRHRVSECHVCLNCLDACNEQSLSYGGVSAAERAKAPKLDIGRRRVVLTTVASVAIAPVMRVAGSGFGSRAYDAIRPPGALDEGAFLARCITCGACSAACPTGVIASDLGRTGVEGLFTPVLGMRRGWCEPSCIRCTEVCPTGALADVTAEAKQAIGGPAEVKIGTAFIDRGRCLPWAMDVPCIVCEEMCPTSPKAIWLEKVERVGRNGQVVTLQRPVMEPALCTGCGLCENRCPVGEQAAIRVSSAGETRDPGNQMLQQPVPA